MTGNRLPGGPPESAPFAVRGRPTAEELGAVLAVLRARSDPGPTDRPVAAYERWRATRRAALNSKCAGAH